MTKIKDTKQHICLDLKYIKCFFGISRRYLTVNTAVCTALEALLDTHRADMHLEKKNKKTHTQKKNKAFGLKRCVTIQTSEL